MAGATDTRSTIQGTSRAAGSTTRRFPGEERCARIVAGVAHDKTMELGCETDGRFRMRLIDYDFVLDEMTEAALASLRRWVAAAHEAGDPSPLLSADVLRGFGANPWRGNG